MSRTFSSLVEDANQDLSEPGQHFFTDTSDKPRFEAYYAGFSVCSHKVRAVLAEKSIGHIGHVVKLFARTDALPENYAPSYVRMRLQGAPGAKMVGAYTGQSSVKSEGFDPCVVPTLVDHSSERVIVDSAIICQYLDAKSGVPNSLIPVPMKSEVLEQVELVDQAPHVAVLYGENPHGDNRPESISKPIEGVHDRKVSYLEEAKGLVPNESGLIAAYDAKIEKEKSAKGFIYDRESMLDAHERMAAHVSALQTQLSKHSDDWVMGKTYTMADTVWSVSLFRLKWLGLGALWEGNPQNSRVSEYVDRAFMRPSFRQAVIDFPMSTPPTPHFDATAEYAQNLFRAWSAGSP